MITFGVLTDQHFGPEARHAGKLRKLTAQAPALVKAFAARMQHEVHPDFVVNLGDCVEDESRDKDLARYRACLDGMRRAGRLYNVAGNHDCINLTPSDLRAAWSLPPDGPLHYSFREGGVHFVVLHTRERKDRDVTLGDEQLAWLEATLAEEPADTIVLMHHSAADQDLRGNRWFEGLPHICLVEERARVRALIRDHGRVRLVLNGHLHWNHLDVIDGIPYLTLQSLIENVEDDAPGVAAAAHAVVRVGGGGVAVEVTGAHPCRYQFARSGVTA